MITQLSQETLNEYASDAQTIDEPVGTDYSQGVRVGRTVPAKWWNWLFSAVTKRAGQSKADAQDMLTELQNTVTDAGLTLDPTDNTQLSQAVDAKAAAKVNEYVSNKQEFLSLWGEVPIPPEFSEYERFVNLEKVGDLYVAVLYGGNYPDLAMCLIVSFDMKHWQLIRDNENMPVHSDGFSIGCVRFNNVYYICLAVNSLYGYVYKSADGYNWSMFYNAGNLYPSSFFFGVLEDNLYLYGYSSLLKLSSDGSTFVDTGLSLASFNSYSGSSSFKSSTAVALNGGKYLIGSYLVDIPNNTSTELVGSGAQLVGQSYYYGVRCRVTALTNGTYMVCAETSVAPWYELVIIVDIDGNVLSRTEYAITGGVDTFARFFIPDNVPACVFVLDAQTGKYIYFSEDGINTQQLPFNNGITSAAYANGYYYLTVAASSNYNVYRIAGALSTTLSDYELISNVPVGNKLRYAGFGSVFFIGSSSFVGDNTYVSTDGCASWTPCKTSDNKPVNSPIFTVEDGIAYTDADNVQLDSRVAYSLNAVNRVIGHTLYLR